MLLQRGGVPAAAAAMCALWLASVCVCHGEGRRPLRLFMATFCARSHVQCLQSLALEMANRSHEITFSLPAGCTHFWTASPDRELTTHRSIHFLPGNDTGGLTVEQGMENLFTRSKHRTGRDIIGQLAEVARLIQITQYADLDAFFREHANEFDFLLCDVHSDVCRDLSLKYSIPLMAMSSVQPFDAFVSPTYFNMFVDFPQISLLSEPSFSWISFWKGRLSQLLLRCLYLLAFTRNEAALDRQRRIERGIVDIPVDIVPSARYFSYPLVVNSYFGFDKTSLVAPSQKFVGTVRNLERELLLSRDRLRDSAVLSTFLDANVSAVGLAARPILYVSVGSLVPLADVVVQELANLFTSSGFPFRVLWSLGKAQQRFLPERLLAYVDTICTPDDDRSAAAMGRCGTDILISSFVPQLAVLSHPRVAGFWTHGGLNSIHESVFAEKPVICSPFYADGVDSCRRMEELRAGMRLAVDGFSDAARTLHGVRAFASSLSSFAPAVKRLSALLRHAGGVAAAADFLEDVAYHGYSHLIVQDIFLPWYIRFNLDVAVFVGLGLLLVAKSLALAWKLLMRWIGRQAMSYPRPHAKLKQG